MLLIRRAVARRFHYQRSATITATPQQALINQLVTSLRAVLPFAENERTSLHHAEHRDGDDCGAEAADDAIEVAKGVLARVL
ncbi:hypothetical protein [Rhodanobacter sp. C05]|uniref:hypothetical protein n=1 Tax=Rhodanobacter sp. C05 TaxID=1945855 RepID=UPI000984E8CA|nr:hypothetical protein [Rhodanobacter sp. C05]OOG43469.1 hypothetical protein B0E51_01275 [Rhodanobacter sp. C05]